MHNTITIWEFEHKNSIKLPALSKLKVYVIFGETKRKAPVRQFENAKIKLDYQKKRESI